MMTLTRYGAIFVRAIRASRIDEYIGTSPPESMGRQFIWQRIICEIKASQDILEGYYTSEPAMLCLGRLDLTATRRGSR